MFDLSHVSTNSAGAKCTRGRKIIFIIIIHSKCQYKDYGTFSMVVIIFIKLLQNYNKKYKEDLATT